MRNFLSSLKVSTIGICAVLSFTVGSASAADSLSQQTLAINTANIDAIPPANANKQTAEVYIVQFTGQPALNFSGSGAMAATKPADGQKINVQSSSVQNYRAFLAQTHDQSLRNCGADQANKLSHAH